MKYYTPEFEIELFEVMDVITTSKPDKEYDGAAIGDHDIDWSEFDFGL